MEKSANRPSLRTLVYCIVLTLVGGCAMEPATAEDVAQAELEQTHVRQQGETTVTTPVPTGSGTVQTVAPPSLTLPDAPLPSGAGDVCRCAWGSWSTGGGMMCAGIRCNEFCDMATRGCVEHHACVAAGI